MNFSNYLILRPLQSEMMHLNSSLADYGLRPEDWEIIPEQLNEFKIENIEEPSFFFKGTTVLKKGRKIWQKIQLLGL